jgi:ParB/RepB/Spo0J family partition protein
MPSTGTDAGDVLFLRPEDTMTASTETETSDELFMHIRLKELTPSRFQPRDRRPDADLVESVRQHGVVTPGLARPTPDGPTAYEVVFGHCRWRAAELAELETMPFVVRELDDVTALELMLVENLRRSDLHPMDEAEGYHQLHEQHGQAVEQIADRVGKSKAYVYARLKLLALQTEGREAFRAGELDASVALYLARVPASLQHMALEKMRDQADEGERLSARSAAWLLRSQFMLQLSVAPFTTSDADLVPEAGSCTDCLKRTGNQRELFADVESADVCTDPVCYRTKVDALWQLRTSAAGAEGITVLSEKDTKRLFPYGGSTMSTSEYIDLAALCYSVKGSKPYKKLLGKKAPPVSLVRDPDGNVHEVVERKAAEKALVELGHLKKAAPATSSNSSSKKDKEAAAKARAAEELNKKVAQAVVVEIAEKAERDAPTAPQLFALVEVLEGTLYRGPDHALERRGLKRDSLKKMNERGLWALLVEYVAAETLQDVFGGQQPRDLLALAKAFKVDVLALEKKAKAEREAAAKMPAELKTKPVKPAAKGKK